ncbi:putative DEAD/DEAH box helicase [Monocercomonoides exilis]|uniref:putative DEAD/DEAH box helicase n=1 Tax=Monocercomonoides exilis TaxID=2049356 RepID=UPI00355AA509|nr:putative DEAD/DEAH box helicase [Monocercomonoides exilis]|eukprot:MONOS_12399.1-p1 / transcript=MONOS_12399.1 / gene=MONOS_12399 / organism=Monocercomonoides_exilis_PA203 / gene_product=DEAD/DEAH box helicase / transcript_product=DEAD/DEAH box helicase / location=Mono_scaffold00684:13497-24283(-) / protein_length=3578 / sequence_SO=supercontig / SO=protein_coding / is_pseudo=false
MNESNNEIVPSKSISIHIPRSPKKITTFFAPLGSGKTKNDEKSPRTNQIEKRNLLTAPVNLKNLSKAQFLKKSKKKQASNAITSHFKPIVRSARIDVGHVPRFSTKTGELIKSQENEESQTDQKLQSTHSPKRKSSINSSQKSVPRHQLPDSPPSFFPIPSLTTINTYIFPVSVDSSSQESSGSNSSSPQSSLPAMHPPSARQPSSSSSSIRLYQHTITQTCLLFNTLVCIPTGTGKTLIAAVVLFNYLRWFPTGCVVFMAPTRQLLAQQFRSCKRILGVGEKESVMMTGLTDQRERDNEWKQKRAFFVTPHVFVNDIQRDAVSCAERIVCVVVDEAHRARGNQPIATWVNALEQLREKRKKGELAKRSFDEHKAEAEKKAKQRLAERGEMLDDIADGLTVNDDSMIALDALNQFPDADEAVDFSSYRHFTTSDLNDKGFRIIALSATPGADRAEIQQLITTLHIERIEFRARNDPEVSPFVHARRIETIGVSLRTSRPIMEAQRLLNQVFYQSLVKLTRFGTGVETKPEYIRQQQLVMLRQRWREDMDAQFKIAKRATMISNANRLQMMHQNQQQQGTYHPPAIASAAQVKEIQAKRALGEAEFAVAISLAHAEKLLQEHGIHSCRTYLTNYEDSILAGSLGADTVLASSSSSLLTPEEFEERRKLIMATKIQGRVSKAKQQLIQSEEWKELMKALNVMEQESVAHPKIRVLEEVILDHFQREEAKQSLQQRNKNKNEKTDLIPKSLDENYHKGADLNPSLKDELSKRSEEFIPFATDTPLKDSSAIFPHSSSSSSSSSSNPFQIHSKDGLLTSTRVMIFSEYRSSVDEIVAHVNQLSPSIKAAAFVGKGRGKGRDMTCRRKSKIPIKNQESGTEMKSDSTFEAEESAAERAEDSALEGDEECLEDADEWRDAAEGEELPDFQLSLSADGSLTGMTPSSSSAAKALDALNIFPRFSITPQRTPTTDKDQARIMEQFLKGEINVIVSTSIGEEGLDIGEVDLCVCYDAPPSMQRMVQRIGRTGRKREGRVVVLVTDKSDRGSAASSGSIFDKSRTSLKGDSESETNTTPAKRSPFKNGEQSLFGETDSFTMTRENSELMARLIKTGLLSSNSSNVMERQEMKVRQMNALLSEASVASGSSLSSMDFTIGGRASGGISFDGSTSSLEKISTLSMQQMVDKDRERKEREKELRELQNEMIVRSNVGKGGSNAEGDDEKMEPNGALKQIRGESSDKKSVGRMHGWVFFSGKNELIPVVPQVKFVRVEVSEEEMNEEAELSEKEILEEEEAEKKKKKKKQLKMKKEQDESKREKREREKMQQKADRARKKKEREELELLMKAGVIKNNGRGKSAAELAKAYGLKSSEKKEKEPKQPKNEEKKKKRKSKKAEGNLDAEEEKEDGAASNLKEISEEKKEEIQKAFQMIGVEIDGNDFDEDTFLDVKEDSKSNLFSIKDDDLLENSVFEDFEKQSRSSFLKGAIEEKGKESTFASKFLSVLNVAHYPFRTYKLEPSLFDSCVTKLKEADDVGYFLNSPSQNEEAHESSLSRNVQLFRDCFYLSRHPEESAVHIPQKLTSFYSKLTNTKEGKTEYEFDDKEKKYEEKEESMRNDDFNDVDFADFLDHNDADDPTAFDGERADDVAFEKEKEKEQEQEVKVKKKKKRKKTKPQIVFDDIASIASQMTQPHSPILNRSTSASSSPFSTPIKKHSMMMHSPYRSHLSPWIKRPPLSSHLHLPFSQGLSSQLINSYSQSSHLSYEQKAAMSMAVHRTNSDSKSVKTPKKRKKKRKKLELEKDDFDSPAKPKSQKESTIEGDHMKENEIQDFLQQISETAPKNTQSQSLVKRHNSESSKQMHTLDEYSQSLSSPSPTWSQLKQREPLSRPLYGLGIASPTAEEVKETELILQSIHIDEIFKVPLDPDELNDDELEENLNGGNEIDEKDSSFVEREAIEITDDFDEEAAAKMLDDNNETASNIKLKQEENNCNELRDNQNSSVESNTTLSQASQKLALLSIGEQSTLFPSAEKLIHQISSTAHEESQDTSQHPINQESTSFDSQTAAFDPSATPTVTNRHLSLLVPEKVRLSQNLLHRSQDNTSIFDQFNFPSRSAIKNSQPNSNIAFEADTLESLPFVESEKTVTSVNERGKVKQNLESQEEMMLDDEKSQTTRLSQIERINNRKTEKSKPVFAVVANTTETESELKEKPKTTISEENTCNSLLESGVTEIGNSNISISDETLSPLNKFFEIQKTKQEAETTFSGLRKLENEGGSHYMSNEGTRQSFVQISKRFERGENFREKEKDTLSHVSSQSDTKMQDTPASQEIPFLSGEKESIQKEIVPKEMKAYEQPNNTSQHTQSNLEGNAFVGPYVFPSDTEEGNALFEQRQTQLPDFDEFEPFRSTTGQYEISTSQHSVPRSQTTTPSIETPATSQQSHQKVKAEETNATKKLPHQPLSSLQKLHLLSKNKVSHGIASSSAISLSPARSTSPCISPSGSPPIPPPVPPPVPPSIRQPISPPISLPAPSSSSVAASVISPISSPSISPSSPLQMPTVTANYLRVRRNLLRISSDEQLSQAVKLVDPMNRSQDKEEAEQILTQQIQSDSPTVLSPLSYSQQPAVESPLPLNEKEYVQKQKQQNEQENVANVNFRRLRRCASLLGSQLLTQNFATHADISKEEQVINKKSNETREKEHQIGALRTHEGLLTDESEASQAQEKDEEISEENVDQFGIVKFKKRTNITNGIDEQERKRKKERKKKIRSAYFEDECEETSAEDSEDERRREKERKRKRKLKKMKKREREERRKLGLEVESSTHSSEESEAGEDDSESEDGSNRKRRTTSEEEEEEEEEEELSDESNDTNLSGFIVSETNIGSAPVEDNGESAENEEMPTQSPLALHRRLFLNQVLDSPHRKRTDISPKRSALSPYSSFRRRKANEPNFLSFIPSTQAIMEYKQQDEAQRRLRKMKEREKRLQRKKDRESRKKTDHHSTSELRVDKHQDNSESNEYAKSMKSSNENDSRINNTLKLNSEGIFVSKLDAGNEIESEHGILTRNQKKRLKGESVSDSEQVEISLMEMLYDESDESSSDAEEENDDAEGEETEVSDLVDKSLLSPEEEDDDDENEKGIENYSQQCELDEIEEDAIDELSTFSSDEEKVKCPKLKKNKISNVSKLQRYAGLRQKLQQSSNSKETKENASEMCNSSSRSIAGESNESITSYPIEQHSVIAGKNLINHSELKDINKPTNILSTLSRLNKKHNSEDKLPSLEAAPNDEIAKTEGKQTLSKVNSLSLVSLQPPNNQPSVSFKPKMSIKQAIAALAKKKQNNPQEVANSSQFVTHTTHTNALTSISNQVIAQDATKLKQTSSAQIKSVEHASGMQDFPSLTNTDRSGEIRNEGLNSEKLITLNATNGMKGQVGKHLQNSWLQQNQFSENKMSSLQQKMSNQFQTAFVPQKRLLSPPISINSYSRISPDKCISGLFNQKETNVASHSSNDVNITEKFTLLEKSDEASKSTGSSSSINTVLDQFHPTRSTPTATISLSSNSFIIQKPSVQQNTPKPKSSLLLKIRQQKQKQQKLTSAIQPNMDTSKSLT